MATVERFEEIEAWQKTRELTRKVYRVTSGGLFARDFDLRDQVRRASVSIMSNIAEGFGRGGNKEFIQFLSIATGSTTEVRSQLFVALDADYLSEGLFKKIYGLARSTGNLIGGFIRYLTRSAAKGVKFA